MDESGVSDCVVLDQTMPTIVLDDTVNDVESGEDVSSNDGDLEMELAETAKFTKSLLMNIVFSSDAHMQTFGPELIEFMQQKCNNLGVDLDNERNEISFFEKVDKDEEQPMFTIDSTPSKGKTTGSDVPRYSQSLAETLSNDMTPKKADGGGRRAMSCFNCDGDHNLRDCKEPRNHQKINANRKSRPGKTERYHVDLSQKYGHCRPGHISKKLAKALGLHSKDVPLHIFRMRKLGYPPGWLAEARVSHSGINLFGSDGTVVRESDDEDGELEQAKDKYDAEKIIEYAGFNVDPPEDAYDDAKLFGCPPMQEEHRKETFLANLGVNLATAYKRRKMNSFPMNEGLVVCHETVEMDVAEDDEDGEIKDTSEAEPPPSPPPLPTETEQSEMLPPPPVPTSSGTDAATEAESKDPPTGVNDSLIDFIINRDANESSADSPVAAAEVVVEKRQLSSKEMVEGTPLLKSASPYDKLPDGDKWAVGVSDVINFENLPDSVGKYAKMKVLIKKVQNVVKQINSE